MLEIMQMYLTLIAKGNVMCDKTKVQIPPGHPVCKKGSYLSL